MSNILLSKSYTAPPICLKEVLRYSGSKFLESETEKVLKNVIEEAESVLNYDVCYKVLNVSVLNDLCDFGEFSLKSSGLAKNLSGCKCAVVFCATIGVGIDRLVSKYSRVSQVKALLLDALGSERIEALCDTFCRDIKKELGKSAKPRFSPGYGDLPLEGQTVLFSSLQPQKRIGVTLNNSLLMTPSKSVTAIMGLFEGEEEKQISKCALCDKTNCIFRGV